MPTSFARKILNIDNGIGNDRPIQWSVFDHETNISTRFNTKLEAAIYKNTLKHATLYFHWYENQFVNNTAEPQESYEDLRRQRAQEIRDKYDYVRLWYSGGSDSQTALNSFVKNNIHIDEIVVHLLPDHNVSDPLQSGSREVLISALPYLESIKHLIPNTKITKVIPDKADYIKYLSGPDAVGELPFLHGMDAAAFIFQMSTPQAAWEKVIDSSNNVNFCDVYGGTKARVCTKNGKFYFYLADPAITDFYLSSRSEDFFISKTNPRLFLKTVHMLVKFLSNSNKTENEINYYHSGLSNTLEYNLVIGRDPINKIALHKTTSNEFYIAEHNITIRGLKQSLFVNNVIKDNWWNSLFKKHKQSYYIMKDLYPYLWQTDSQNNLDPNLGYAGNVSKLFEINTGRLFDSTEIYPKGFLKN